MEAVSALDVTRARPAVVRCLAEAPVLDAFEELKGARAIRAAHDELLLVGEPASTGELVAAAQGAADTLVVDQSDGWEALTLAGPWADEAFRRISAVPLPAARPGVAQGAVGGLAAKVLAYPDHIVVLVVSTAADYLYERIRGAVAGERP